MKITVKLFATLREKREKMFELDIKENAVPKDVIEALHIPLQEVAIIMINGRSAKLESKLIEHDVLALFPAVGGG